MAPFVEAESSGLVRRSRARHSEELGAGELLAHELGDDTGVRLALRLLHDLADEEAEEAFLAATVRSDLAGVLLEDPVDDRLELAGVRDGLLREIRISREAGLGRASRSPRRTQRAGSRSRASTSFASSAAGTAAGSTPAPTSLFAITFARGDRRPRRRRPSRPRAGRDRP